MKRKADMITVYTVVIAALVLFAGRQIMAGQLWDVRYDILFWDAAGSGHVPLWYALLSYVVGACAIISCIYAAVRALQGKRLLWVTLLPIGIFAVLGLRVEPTERDIPRVAFVGQRVVHALEAYKHDYGHYPDHLRQLAPKYLKAIPATGLVPARRFYYARKGTESKDRGPWFPGADELVGNSDYALAVPFVPGGTLLYRPTHRYDDLEAAPVRYGWARSSRD